MNKCSGVTILLPLTHNLDLLERVLQPPVSSYPTLHLCWGSPWAQRRWWCYHTHILPVEPHLQWTAASTVHRINVHINITNTINCFNTSLLYAVMVAPDFYPDPGLLPLRCGDHHESGDCSKEGIKQLTVIYTCEWQLVRHRYKRMLSRTVQSVTTKKQDW